MVTGALVVMKDYFRAELLNTDLVARLLATADKSGIYADADVYGQGLLDLAAATSPVGSPRIAIDQRVEGAAVDLTATGLGLGDALGDGLTQALAGHEIAAFDDLGAPFWYALDSFTDTADGPAARTRLRGFMTQPLSEWETPSWRPSLGAVQSIDGTGSDAPLRLGMLDASPLGEDAGHLSLAGRALTLSTAGQGSLSAGAEIGTVSTSVQGGLIANVSPLTTSAFALQAVRPLNDGDTFTLSLSQPLRVESGHASLSVPVGRTKDGLVRRRPVTADLVPTGRQIEVTAQWRWMLSTGGELRLGAAWTRHPGHAASAEPDLTLLAGWRHTF